jgi:hypothetical protein
MDRNPSQRRAPRVYYETQPTPIYVYADPENFMEIVQSLTGQAAPTNAAGAAADRGAIVPAPALEPVQQQQPMLAAAMVPGPRASATESTISEEEVEMEESEEERAIKEGRFSLLPKRNAGADEPKPLNLFPLAPSSSHSVKDETEK